MGDEEEVDEQYDERLRDPHFCERPRLSSSRHHPLLRPPPPPFVSLSNTTMSRRAAPAVSPFGVPQRRAIHDPNESTFSRFMREQVWSPENLPGNLSILTAVSVFFGGIAAIRSWGELMIPA